MYYTRDVVTIPKTSIIQWPLRVIAIEAQNQIGNPDQNPKDEIHQQPHCGCLAIWKRSNF